MASNNYSSNPFDDSTKSKSMNDPGFEDTNRDFSGNKVDSGFGQGQSPDTHSATGRPNVTDRSAGNAGLGMPASYETTAIGSGNDSPRAGIDSNSKERYNQLTGQIDTDKEAHGTRSGGTDAGSKNPFGQNSSNIDHGSLNPFSQSAGGIYANSDLGDGAGFGSTRFPSNEDTFTTSYSKGQSEVRSPSSEASPNTAGIQQQQDLDVANKPGQTSQYFNAGSTQGGGYGGGNPDSDRTHPNKAEATPVLSSGNRDHDGAQQSQSFKSPLDKQAPTHGDRGGQNVVSFDKDTKGGLFASAPHGEDSGGTAQHREPTKPLTDDTSKRTGPSLSDKIKGKVEQAAGKVVGNEAMVERGRERQAS